MHWVYYFGRGLIRVLAFPYHGWKVKGRENVPAKGPFLVVCNHLHISDPPIVAASLPLKCVFMAKKELWEKAWPRFWVSNFGAFPVGRGGIDRESLRQAEEWLKKGVSVIMFPEGKRSKDGRMQPALSGAAVIAARLGVPVLPVSIIGTDKLNHAKRYFLHNLHITVTIGTHFNLSNNGKLTKEQRQQVTDEMMGRVAALLPPEYRGVYGDKLHA